MGRKGTEVNKAENISRILHRLMTTQRGWRVEQLIDELGVAPRTYRDYRTFLQSLTFLQDREGPLIVEEGEAEQRRLVLRTWRKVGARDADFQARFASVFMAQQMLGFLQRTPLQEAFSHIVQELQGAVTDRSVLEYALRESDRKFIYRPHAPKHYQGHEQRISELLTCVLYSKRAEITYRSGTSQTRYSVIIEPLTIASSKSALYVMARNPAHHDPDEVRFYAVDRISRVRKLTEGFDYPARERYDPDDHFDGNFGIYSSSQGQAYDVELVFADVAWLKTYLRERQWHPTQTFEERGDGRLTMRFRIRDMDTVWRWIRSFGDDVELRSPPGPIPRSDAEQRAWAQRVKRPVP